MYAQVMWSKASAWLKSHRRLALALSAAFLIFELSRAASIGQALLPGFGAQAGALIESITSRPLRIAIPTMTLAVVLFVAPMAAVVYFGNRIRRAMSRYWTGVKQQG